MPDKNSIDWTNSAWNPVTGCTEKITQLKVTRLAEISSGTQGD